VSPKSPLGSKTPLPNPAPVPEDRQASRELVAVTLQGGAVVLGLVAQALGATAQNSERS
jgi:hypothetical protein